MLHFPHAERKGYTVRRVIRCHPLKRAMSSTILFLCTGNYYRSRFAEIAFNHLAESAGLVWRAESRGFGLFDVNVGPISSHALEALQKAGFPVPENPRFPRVATLDDLQRAGRLIAVQESEHRPLMRERFPEWVGRVEYWDIHDVGWAEPGVAMPQLQSKVASLVVQLSRTIPSDYPTSLNSNTRS